MRCCASTPPGGLASHLPGPGNLKATVIQQGRLLRWLELVGGSDVLRQVGDETFDEMDVLDGDAQVAQ